MSGKTGGRSTLPSMLVLICSLTWFRPGADEETNLDPECTTARAASSNDISGSAWTIGTAAAAAAGIDDSSVAIAIGITKGMLSSSEISYSSCA